MKLQNLIIIFIIIIIPIVLIFSLYLKLEIKTIMLQTDYDEKLIEAAKESVEAFEINTTEWKSKYSLLANSKRQDLMSSINVFTTSLANKLGIGGTSKESILNYIPAIVYIMYDGYYIYSPTYVPETITNDNGVQLFYYANSGSEGSQITASATQNIGGTIVSGEPMYVRESGQALTGKYNGETITFTTNRDNAKKNYEHVLKTFVPYTATYGSYIINYTLDNYIRIYAENQSREGYIIEDLDKIEIPVNNISGIKYNGYTIEPETLTENIYIRDNMQEDAKKEAYPYIYNSNNDKRYYDSTQNKFFIVNNNYIKVYLPEAEIGSALAEYKKVLIRPNASSWDYLELYQLLNGNDKTWYYLNSDNKYIKYYAFQPSIDNEKDCSAINYYVQNYNFNNWLNSNRIQLNEVLSQKRQNIINNINNNLNLSISNYNANSKIDYKILEISDENWEQALSNISMIAFFQGKKIGLKTYNNYVVVTSTENNEYVSEDSLSYLNTEDEYYHRYGCSEISSNTSLEKAYRNTEFKTKSYSYIKNGENFSGYYNTHSMTDAQNKETSTKQCFECIVNRNNFIFNDTLYNKVHYTALARERYVQMSKTALNIKVNIEKY